MQVVVMVLVPLLFVLFRVQLVGVGCVHELNGFCTGAHPVFTLDGTVPLVPPTTPMVLAVIEPPFFTVNDDELLELLITPHDTLTAGPSIVTPCGAEPLSAMMVLGPLVLPAMALTLMLMVLYPITPRK